MRTPAKLLPALCVVLALLGASVTSAAELTKERALELANNLAVVFTKGDPGVAEKTFDPMVRMRSPVLPQEAVGIQNLQAFAQTNRVAFPDLAIQVYEVMVDGDTMVARFRISGTQTGPLGPLPATGRSFSIPGVAVAKVENDRILEWQDYWNAIDLYASLGFTLSPPKAPMASDGGR